MSRQTCGLLSKFVCTSAKNKELRRKDLPLDLLQRVEYICCWFGVTIVAGNEGWKEFQLSQAIPRVSAVLWARQMGKKGNLTQQVATRGNKQVRLLKLIIWFGNMIGFAVSARAGLRGGTRKASRWQRRMKHLPSVVHDAVKRHSASDWYLMGRVCRRATWQALMLMPGVGKEGHSLYVFAGNNLEYVGEATNCRRGCDTGSLKMLNEHFEALVVHDVNEGRVTSFSRKVRVTRKDGMGKVFVRGVA